MVRIRVYESEIDDAPPTAEYIFDTMQDAESWLGKQQYPLVCDFQVD